LQAILSLEHIDGSESIPASNNASYDRVHLLGMILQKRLDCCEALSHPRSLVEQIGRTAKDRKINLDSFAADLLDFPHRFCVQSLGFFVAEKLELIRSRHAVSQSGT